MVDAKGAHIFSTLGAGTEALKVGFGVGLLLLDWYDVEGLVLRRWLLRGKRGQRRSKAFILDQGRYAM